MGCVVRCLPAVTMWTPGHVLLCLFQRPQYEPAVCSVLTRLCRTRAPPRAVSKPLTPSTRLRVFYIFLQVQENHSFHWFVVFLFGRMWQNMRMWNVPHRPENDSKLNPGTEAECVCEEQRMKTTQELDYRWDRNRLHVVNSKLFNVVS